jgi:hypothetical protein
VAAIGGGRVLGDGSDPKEKRRAGTWQRVQGLACLGCGLWELGHWAGPEWTGESQGEEYRISIPSKG